MIQNLWFDQKFRRKSIKTVLKSRKSGRSWAKPSCTLKWTVGDDSEGLISNMNGRSMTSTKNLLLNQPLSSDWMIQIKVQNQNFLSLWKVSKNLDQVKMAVDQTCYIFMRVTCDTVRRFDTWALYETWRNDYVGIKIKSYARSQT